jgi:hypothetical protein
VGQAIMAPQTEKISIPDIRTSEDIGSMLSRIFSNLPGFIYQCKNDKNWTMEFMSEGCIDVTGYRPNELVKNKKRSYEEIICKEDRDKVRIAVDESFKKNDHFQVEYRIRRKDGSICWVWERGLGARSEDGDIILIDGYITDISERKTAELKILETQQKYEYLYKLSPFGIIMVDHKGKIQDVNKTFCKMSGYAKDEFINLPLKKIPFGIKKNMYSLSKGLGKLIKHNSSDNFYFKWKHRSGEIRLADSHVRSITIEGNNFYICVIRDITAQDDEKNELIQSKIKTEALLDASPDLMFVLDKKGFIIDFKSDVKNLFYQKDDMIGKNVYSLLPNDVATITKDAIERTLQTHRMQIYNYSLDIPQRGTLHFEARMVESNLDQVTAIIRDMSDYKEMELKLIDAKEKAEESNRLKTAFLANMSHEIRTPMNSIIGFSDLLSKNKNEEEAKKYIQLIKSSSNYLLQLIEDVMLYSRLQSENIPLKRDMVNVRGILQEIYDTFFHSDKMKNLKFKIDYSHDCKELNIIGDYEKIWQVLTNFINNAIKYTQKGSVILGAKTEGNRIKFFVEDTGIGIGSNELDKIFDRFYRTDATRLSAIGGTGLGLSIAQELVEIMHGEIGVNSICGEGSQFYFYLPLEKAENTLPQNDYTHYNAKEMNQFTILIAEDDDLNYYYLHELMCNCVFKIDRAKNGKEAIEQVSKNSYNLILMDIKMPVMDGIEAITIIKEDHPNIPIIAQTAYVQPEEVERIKKAGVDAIISKPIAQKDLEITINQLFDFEICSKK